MACEKQERSRFRWTINIAAAREGRTPVRPFAHRANKSLTQSSCATQKSLRCGISLYYELRSGGRFPTMDIPHGIFARRAKHRREAIPREVTLCEATLCEATLCETTPREARHNRNRLQANEVSAAGGKTATLFHSARRAPQPQRDHAASGAMTSWNILTMFIRAFVFSSKSSGL